MTTQVFALSIYGSARFTESCRKMKKKQTIEFLNKSATNVYMEKLVQSLPSMYIRDLLLKILIKKVKAKKY